MGSISVLWNVFETIKGRKSERVSVNTIEHQTLPWADTLVRTEEIHLLAETAPSKSLAMHAIGEKLAGGKRVAEKLRTGRFLKNARILFKPEMWLDSRYVLQMPRQYGLLQTLSYKRFI